MAQAARDENFVPTLLGVSNADGTTPVAVYADPTTHRLLVDLPGGSGSVTSVSVVTANGFAGTVATATSTPAITLTTTVNSPVLAGNGTAIAAATTTGSGSTVVLNNSPVFVDDITVGVASSATGSILFKGTTSGTVTLSVADAAGTYTLKLPTTDGNAGEFLQTDGAGNTTWATATAGAGGLDTEVQYNNVGSLAGITGATSNGTTLTITSGRATTDFSPSSNDGATLGTSLLGFSDLFLATGALLNFGNGNSVVTHSSGILTVSTGDLRVTTAGTNTASAVTVGGTQTLTNKTLTSPVIGTIASNTLTLGTGTFTTLTFDAGASDPVLTAASGTLTLSTGDLRVTTAGTNTASVVTVGGTQTLTNKTLTSPVIGTIASNTLTLGTGTFTTLTFDAGASDPVLTAASGTLTLSTGDLRVTTAGTNTASVVTVGGTQTLTNKTLTSPAITTGTYSGTQLLAEGAGIGLDPSLSADGTWSGITMTATAGYTQAFGDLVYLDPTDSRWEATDANSASGADGDARGILGMVVVAGTDGASCTVLLQGVIRADAKFPTFTVNNPIYVSETAGAVTQTQPTTTDAVIRIVGAALTTDAMYFNPDQTWITPV